VAFAPQSSGFFSPVEPLVLLLDGQSGDLAVVGESQNLAPARGCKFAHKPNRHRPPRNGGRGL